MTKPALQGLSSVITQSFFNESTPCPKPPESEMFRKTDVKAILHILYTEEV